MIGIYIVLAKNGATEAVSVEFSSTKYYDLVAFWLSEIPQISVIFC